MWHVCLRERIFLCCKVDIFFLCRSNSIFFGAAISQLINHQSPAALTQGGVCKHFKSSKLTFMPFLQIILDLLLSITSMHQLFRIQLNCSPWIILFPLCKPPSLINISILTSNKKQFYYWILPVFFFFIWAAYCRRVTYKRNGIYWQIYRFRSQGNV